MLRHYETNAMKSSENAPGRFFEMCTWKTLGVYSKKFSRYLNNECQCYHLH